ncbi:39f2c703-68f6-47e8-aa48-295b184ccf03 [Sclerotinia trifoliorum]|uniref:39f2c703-68f6-47e8-aa48-295b184ccf03 n=1 Tax=Sclerotinia trifoliorum TaxID=28548 RepID=A0A8H2VZE4_9HELO|nr:39f2c703-68f6-47e8-aa48-295b184ccf03 [Sclerotinia trifoliorum]
MPPIPAQIMWTPDIIATVVYRVTMVFVGLMYTWRKYRQPLRTDDMHRIAELLAVRTSLMEATFEGSQDPTPTKSSDSNDIVQAAVQTFEALVSTTLDTDSDGTPDTLSINLELEQVQSSKPDRRQGVNRSSKEN